MIFHLQVEDPTDVGALYGFMTYNSTVWVHHIVRSDYRVSPLTSTLPWPLHRLNVNRLYQRKP